MRQIISLIKQSSIAQMARNTNAHLYTRSILLAYIVTMAVMVTFVPGICHIININLILNQHGCVYLSPSITFDYTVRRNSSQTLQNIIN